jgi:putative ABC transport system permease protein
MIRNYFTVAIRNLRRNKVVSFINIAGLSIGLACCILILVYVDDDWSFDTLATERRTKEIGIRKVLGASVTNLVKLLSLNFVTLVLLANLLAIPVAWWALNKWLQDFAFRITLHWWVFALAILITLAIAALTVGLRALKVAITNPVNNLRTE